MDLKKHFEKYRAYYAAPLIIIALFFVVLKACDAYPFSKIGISNYDLLAQICPFLEHFYDVFEGKSSLFYSTAIMGGADVFGTLAYCAVSPFTFIFLLFGKGNVYYATSFVLPLKLACAALSMVFFAKKVFKSLDDVVVLIVAIAYAYCGYTFVANTYINWLDFLIYTPFVALGFKRLVEEKKIRYFAVAYALMIYTCFSIACFALLLVYLILMAYGLIKTSGEERCEVVAKTCLALVLAVALALPIMLPALSAYLKSGRNTGLFENIFKPLPSGHLYSKFTYIVTDALFVYLAILYFIKKGFNDSESVFLFVAGIIILVPVVCDEACNLLNAGSYMSYSLRFGFLNAFYGAYLSLKLLNEVKLEEEVKGEKKSFAAAAVIAFSSLVALCIAVFFVKVANGENIYGVDGKDTNDFASVFAHSVGGLEYVAPASCAALLAFIAATLTYRYKLVNGRTAVIAVAVVVGVQTVFYNVFLVAGNLFDPVRYEQYNQIVRIIEEEKGDIGYYRIKDYDDALSNDAAFTTHTNCFSVFSSVIDSANFTPSLFFGYDGNEVNCMKSSGGNFFGDALLGYKYYFIHNDGKAHSSQSRSYVKKIDETQLEYFAAAENTLCFPVAFRTGSGELDFIGDGYADYTSLYRFLGGEGNAFSLFEISDSDIDYDDVAEVWTVSVHALQGGKATEGEWYLYSSFPSEYDAYYCINGYDAAERTPLSAGLTDLGYKKNSSSTVCIKADGKALNKSIIKQYCKAACMPLTKVKQLSNAANQKKAELNEKGNRFFVKTTAEAGEYLFMSYVAIDGFSAKVNGKTVELIDNGLGFILLPLEEGENEVELTYSSPYPLLGLVGGIVGGVVAVAVYLCNKKKKVFNFIKKPLFIAAYVLAVGVFGFFIAYPSSVFLVKLMKLVFLGAA